MHIIGIIAAVITAALTFRIFFEGFDDLWEAIKFYFTPDLWSWFKGNFSEDFFAEIKLIIWLGVSAGVGYGVHQLIN